MGLPLESGPHCRLHPLHLGSPRLVYGSLSGRWFSPHSTIAFCLIIYHQIRFVIDKKCDQTTYE